MDIEDYEREKAEEKLLMKLREIYSYGYKI